MRRDILVDRAKTLRIKGFSLREISDQLKISKSTASLWLRDVMISSEGKRRILELSEKGRKKSVATTKNRIERENRIIESKVSEVLGNFSYSNPSLKLICALLYWCEGEKTKRGSLAFINSDPQMIKYFLKMFREAFDIDEGKFRVMLHVHDYHDSSKQINFWSQITGISKKQFYKPHDKNKGGKRKKMNYQGCVSVRYYDSKIAREMFCLIDGISMQ